MISEIDLSYAIAERVDLYGGLRYWNLDADLDIVGGGPLGATLSASKTEDWIDPLIGARYVQPLGADWSLVIRGDLGGWGVGSDFAWHATAYFNWAMSEHASLLFGARFLGVDYDDGSGPSRFVWDVTEGGPAAGFAWRF